MNRLQSMIVVYATQFLMLAPALADADVRGEAHLDAASFARHWQVASEARDYRLNFLSGAEGDTLEIVAPRGFTLWRREAMEGDVLIEYDACVMVDDQHPGDRLSDLNAFWMASFPESTGVFVNSYRMALYYLGYGGNGNTTTRFRRYTGDARGVDDVAYRPPVLVEYTDAAHLNVAGRWRHFRITAQAGGRVTCDVDGERLVDYFDPEPLRRGYFGFRTTTNRTRITGFRCQVTPPVSDRSLALRWVEPPLTAAGAAPASAAASQAADGLMLPVAFGVPFAAGTTPADATFRLTVGDTATTGVDFYPLAYHPDGSVKWGGFAGAVSARADGLRLSRVEGKAQAKARARRQPARPEWSEWPAFTLRTAYADGRADTLVVDSVGVEREGALHRIVRLAGHCGDACHIVRVAQTAGSPIVTLTHTFVNTRPDDAPAITCMELLLPVALTGEAYNRHVAFMLDDGTVWHEPIQPLTGRRQLPDGLYARQMAGVVVPPRQQLDERSQALIADWATWSRFRLSQLSDVGFTLRKSAKDDTPWIGTLSGQRAEGVAYVGCPTGGMMVSMRDFWQSCPSSLLIERATADTALLRVQLWSAEAEPMDLRHYDTEAHGLEAAYEDVQPGMSSPYGIGRTSVVSLMPLAGYPGDEAFARLGSLLAADCQLLPTPRYLYAHRAFGVWSLPSMADRGEGARRLEQQLDRLMQFYVDEQDRRHWYGYWHYGDFMHSFDPVRDEWLYDVGGFAWDNTELATGAALWYQFLRTADPRLWRLSVAMTRHTAEVDVYHAGPHSGLGSRHNVTHWGCGAKEARISQSFWNRFYYYLSGGDPRTGELMTAERDVDTLLYTLDPMRLAQPRSEKYPCTQPARLRIGPDWLAYAGNWFTEWERRQDAAYLTKLLAGMQSISRLPHGFFSGPPALGYDPATGVISWEGDSAVHEGAYHLATLMGGFELLGEMLPELSGLDDVRSFADAYQHYCLHYRAEADHLGRKFLLPRLHAYASAHATDPAQREAERLSFWREFRRNRLVPPKQVSTNGFATWCLDAIYALEVLPAPSVADVAGVGE